MNLQVSIFHVLDGHIWDTFIWDKESSTEEKIAYVWSKEDELRAFMKPKIKAFLDLGGAEGHKYSEVEDEIFEILLTSFGYKVELSDMGVIECTTNYGDWNERIRRHFMSDEDIEKIGIMVGDQYGNFSLGKGVWDKRFKTPEEAKSYAGELLESEEYLNQMKQYESYKVQLNEELRSKGMEINIAYPTEDIDNHAKSTAELDDLMKVIGFEVIETNGYEEDGRYDRYEGKGIKLTTEEVMSFIVARFPKISLERGYWASYDGGDQTASDGGQTDDIFIWSINPRQNK